MVYYELAECFETIGMLAEARTSFEQALAIQPQYELFVGGFASFLYLHGDAFEALEWHLKLIHLVRHQGKKIQKMLTAIQVLSEKLGL